MPDVLVRAEGLSKAYPGAASPVLADASFAIEPGARIALMGPSGSGKTTLMHLISGLDTPSTGSLEWTAAGGAPSGPDPRFVALAFQGESLLPALTVAENVALPLLLAGALEHLAATEAAAMLERVGIGDLADRLPEEVSGGQAQRAALARALVSRPRLVLADEPTGQQDRAHADALLDLLLETAGETGAAVLVATHDPRVASRLATQWEIGDGKLRTETR